LDTGRRRGPVPEDTEFVVLGRFASSVYGFGQTAPTGTGNI